MFYRKFAKSSLADIKKNLIYGKTFEPEGYQGHERSNYAWISFFPYNKNL